MNAMKASPVFAACILALAAVACAAAVAADAARALFVLDAGHRLAMTAPAGWKWHSSPAGNATVEGEVLPADEKGFSARIAIRLNETPLTLEASLPVSRAMVEHARQRVAGASGTSTWRRRLSARIAAPEL